MAMRNLKLGDRNHIISEFYLSHLNHDKLFTIRHFVDNFGLAKTTVFRAIQRADRIRRGGRRGRQETLDRRPGSGRPHALTARQERAVLHAVENKKGASTMRQARRFNVCQTRFATFYISFGSLRQCDACFPPTRKDPFCSKGCKPSKRCFSSAGGRLLGGVEESRL